MSETKAFANNRLSDEVAGELVDLVAATGRGDQKAFRRLYDLTHRKLFGIAFLLLRRRDAAEDAVQEAYLRVWTRAGTFDASKGSPLPWLARIVRNIALDRLSQAKLELEDLDDHIDEIAVAPAPIFGIHELNKCLSSMEPMQRQAWRMTHIEGFSREEVAARLRVPLGTIKSWIFRSSERLKASVQV